ncbi:hypothetical protein M426DRAFT_7620 [Hypoxylon sp. CI-4A]|nr:hypothetical protein M426DRAFT_7620 [Hypoxylon sp. CI-4A]
MGLLVDPKQRSAWRIFASHGIIDEEGRAAHVHDPFYLNEFEEDESETDDWEEEREEESDENDGGDAEVASGNESIGDEDLSYGSDSSGWSYDESDGGSSIYS